MESFITFSRFSIQHQTNNTKSFHMYDTIILKILLLCQIKNIKFYHKIFGLHFNHLKGLSCSFNRYPMQKFYI